MAMTPNGADAMGLARDALFDAGRKAHRLAKAVEKLESVYIKEPDPNPDVFGVPTDDDGTWGRALDPEWTEDAPAAMRPARREAIEATLALRAAVDLAMELIPGISNVMDSGAEPVDQRWTIRTIGLLKKLRGAPTYGYGGTICPSALPMIRAGVPKALREHAKSVMERMEEVKSAIIAGVQPHTSNVMSAELLAKVAAATDRTITYGSKSKLPKTRRGLRRLAATTERDQSILDALDRGMSYREAAKECGVSKSTVGVVAQENQRTGHSVESVPLDGTLEENLRIRGKPRKQGRK